MEIFLQSYYYSLELLSKTVKQGRNRAFNRNAGVRGTMVKRTCPEIQLLLDPSTQILGHVNELVRSSWFRIL